MLAKLSFPKISHDFPKSRLADLFLRGESSFPLNETMYNYYLYLLKVIVQNGRKLWPADSMAITE